MRTRVKICCISSSDEAKMAVSAGADAIGLVARMPSGPGPISDDRIARIAGTLPPGVDLCSGIRSASGLDNGLLQRFMQAVREADRRRNSEH